MSRISQSRRNRSAPGVGALLCLLSAAVLVLLVPYAYAVAHVADPAVASVAAGSCPVHDVACEPDERAAVAPQAPRAPAPAPDVVLTAPVLAAAGPPTRAAGMAGAPGGAELLIFLEVSRR